MQKQPQKILLTGRPGCGKTTVIMKLVKLLQKKNIAGFYTQEIRSAGQRSGFSVRTFAGAEGLLSSIHIRQGPRVGKYRVDVGGFEKIILPELARPSEEADIFLIDEIGKMECYSGGFIQAVTGILAGEIPLVATVALKGGGFITKIKTIKDMVIIEVTQTNRDALPRMIADRVVIL